MSGIRKAPALKSDDWLREQQMRAELEAEAWRRLRESLAEPSDTSPRAAPPAAPRRDIAATAFEHGGPLILTSLVRFVFAALGAYLAWIAGMDSGMGEFEVWLATGAGFLVTLSLSLLEPVRQVVHACVGALRWGLIIGAGAGALWLAMNASSWT